MATKNEKKAEAIRAWALAKGYTQDRHGNLKMTVSSGKQYRLKIQALTVRYEVRTESGGWVRIRGGYLKDIYFTPEGKIAGMRRGTKMKTMYQGPAVLRKSEAVCEDEGPMVLCVWAVCFLLIAAFFVVGFAL